MDNTCVGILVFFVALATSLLVFPWALKFAKRHGIVDNPNARKLQRVPIPVFGGVVVYSGILTGWMTLMLFMESEVLSWGLVAMAIMMLIGTWDDIRDISASLRFLIELVLVGTFIAITGVYIDDLHGLWGVYTLEPWIGIPLSIISGVGTINALNLIDGVDGYSSGYGMLACSCFALAFWQMWNPVIICLAVIVIGAIVPFFLHNVFGARSRMFIGDGGTLMLGMLMVVMAFYALSSKGNLEELEEKGLSLTAFVLAVGCIPLFDTLRVMTLRIVRGRSPFKPDKTHLHHLFIDMGFSHLGAALFILTVNAMVVLICILSWKLGASYDVQTYIVIVLGMLLTFGFYKVMKNQQNGGPCDEEGYPQGTAFWHAMCRLGVKTHKEDKRCWRILRYIMDGPLC
mgnify:FL=1